jgi:primosomal protein N' (replication factor Y)
MIKQTLAEERQVILFQNRRGFAPYLQCFNCGWIPQCVDCDVSLVYHKHHNRLVCHYCGYTEPVPGSCPDCGEQQIVTRGFGTEKLEEEVEILFPEVRVSRMDFDTTRSRRRYERIIRDFESGNTRILVGTQIVTKGLDFDDVGLVGVLHADNMMNFPDFRAYERSFQLISQVAGRSGRKGKRGRVFIQTSQPKHPVIQHVMKDDYHSMYMTQMEERQSFHYPPYYRLMKVSLRHKDPAMLEKASKSLGEGLRRALQSETAGNSPRILAQAAKSSQSTIPEVLGPQSPVVGRVQQLHYRTLMLKLPRSEDINRYKGIIASEIEKIRSYRGYGNLFIIPDVDPY